MRKNAPAIWFHQEARTSDFSKASQPVSAEWLRAIARNPGTRTVCSTSGCFTRERRPTATDLLDPFIVTKNPQRLDDGFIETAAVTSTVCSTRPHRPGTKLCMPSVPHLRISYSLCIHYWPRASGTGPCWFFCLLSNPIKYIIGLENREEGAEFFPS